ncbi:MAG TPA: hypothetical protein VKO45_09215, partial [Methanomicrobiales archaeon]|nr:hypothetical protein [Methanomicrobiales archaeon]
SLPHPFPMHGATIDSTFGFIAARAARYPVIVKKNQPRPILRDPARAMASGDPAIRWLLLNTQRINRFLEGTGKQGVAVTGS